jgi:DNA (cytosine-5)-methyltransferase 1
MANKSSDDGTMRELALFAGAGGGILGGHLLGWRTVCAVEYDAYAASVLVARQNDGCLAPFPVWDDVRTFDGRPWRGIVDVVSGGFPCQDISAAGRGKGIDGEKSGLWGEMARIIGEVRPKFAFVENSPMLTSRGLGRVLGDLSELGYDARWGVVSAADAIFAAGDPCAYHLRERIWIVATDAASKRRGETWRLRREQSAKRITGSGQEIVATDADGMRLAKRKSKRSNDATQQSTAERKNWWEAEPAVGRVVDGMANRANRLKAIGNGQVPAVAALAWRLLTEEQI